MSGMKLNRLILFLLLCLSFRAFSIVHNDKIEFIIKDKTVKDKSFITMLIKNKTSINYYLPIINSSKSEKWNFMLDGNRTSFFFLQRYFDDKYDHEVLCQSGNCNEVDLKYRKLLDNWGKKEKAIRAKDFLLLHSGDSAIIKVSVNLLIKISDYCDWKILNSNKEDSLCLSIIYRTKNNLLENDFLNKKTIKELKKMDYKLYTDEIISNKVALTLPLIKKLLH
jgi:hypothetical protein